MPWFSFYTTLDAINRTLDSLIMFFTTRENDAKAVRLKKKTGQALFISIAYGMMDWLQPIIKLNLFFQERDVDIANKKVRLITIKKLASAMENYQSLEACTHLSSLVGCRRYSTSDCHPTTSSSEQM